MTSWTGTSPWLAEAALLVGSRQVDDNEMTLLGGFRLTTANGSETVGTTGQRLLAMLAIDTHPVPREVLAGRMWPDRPTSRALANLRGVVHRLPRTSAPLVRAVGGTLGIGLVSVDVRRLLEAAHRLLRGQPTPDPVMQDIVQLDCELLPGWDEEWVVIERERLRQLRLLSLEAICDSYSRSGDYGSAVEAGILAAGLEPLRESSHRALIRAHLAEGNYCEALRQYHELCEHLLQQLSIEPSDATRHLLWPEH